MQRSQSLTTLIVLALACLVIAWLRSSLIPLYIAAGLLTLGFLVPVAGDWIHRAWMALGHLLGRVNSWIVIGIVFFLVLTPLAWLRRLFGKDPLRMRPGQESMWVQRDHTYTRDDLDAAS